jgi:F-type H+-transporting ATPase subunit a
MHEPLLFFHIPGVPHYVVYTWVTMALLIAISLIIRMGIKTIPASLQNTFETILDSLLNLFEENMGKSGRFFFPFLATIFLFILMANLIGLVPGFESPTSNLNTTAACAVPVFLATHIFGLKTSGFRYFLHFLGPVRSIFALPLMILMAFVEVLGHLARPVTLAVRLFGNLHAKHMILMILAVLAPWIVPTAILGLGVLVSIVQAFVFVLLSTLYIAAAVEESH